MALHPLRAAEACRDARQIGQGTIIHLLPGHRLEKFMNTQAPGISRRTRCRQDMVRPRRLVTEGHGGLLT